MTEKARIVMKKDCRVMLAPYTIRKGYIEKTQGWTRTHYPASTIFGSGPQKVMHRDLKRPRKEIPPDEIWVEPYHKRGTLYIKIEGEKKVVSVKAELVDEVTR